MDDLCASQSVGLIATVHPVAMDVFRRLGINYFCDGTARLDELCVALGLEPQDVLREIQTREGGLKTPLPRWDQRSLGELIDHILERFHSTLLRDLKVLELKALLLPRCHTVPGETAADLAFVLAELREESWYHLEKEEQQLFPWLRSGQGSTAGMMLHVMHLEHRTEGRLWMRIRALTHHYRVPDGADDLTRSLWQGLEALEASHQEHMHLENNVLAPRAIQDG